MGALVLATLAGACGDDAPDETGAELADLESRIDELADLEGRLARVEVELDGMTATTAAADEPTPPAAADEDEEASGPPHWDYAEAATWGDLDAAYAACGTGAEQSPVDLTQPASQPIADAVVSYVPSAASVTDNGHTVQVNVAAGGSAVIDGASYDLVQFHFHAPSEHTIDGAHSPAEMHLVHADADGNLAVLGVMIVEGADDPIAARILAAVPGVGEEAALDEPLDPSALLPDYLMAYRYPGSLTTPPCSEGVVWSVLQLPVTWGAAQIAELRSHFIEANNRPTQPLNERVLRLDSTPD